MTLYYDDLDEEMGRGLTKEEYDSLSLFDLQTAISHSTAGLAIFDTDNDWRFTPEFWKLSLDDLKRQLSAQTFNAHYLQDPLPDTGNMLNPKWLKWYEQAPVRQSGDQIIESWDTALKPTETSDYSVGLTF